MKSREAIKQWLLSNCVDEMGILDLSCLDFSDFDGDIDISGWKVKGDLYQNCQKVEGNLHQSWQEVNGNLYQYCQEVNGNLVQAKIEKEKNNE